MFTDSQIDEITDVLKAIAHDVRLKLLRTLLDNGEKSVGELEALTGIGQPGLSQQLAILRKAKLVQTRREAKLVFYRLDPKSLRDTARLLCALAGIAPGEARPGRGRGDRRRLSQGSCDRRAGAPSRPSRAEGRRHQPRPSVNKEDADVVFQSGAGLGPCGGLRHPRRYAA